MKQAVVAVVQGPSKREQAYDLSSSKEAFLTAKDTDKAPVFISPEGKLIGFKQQILPFWSEFCKRVPGERTGDKISDSKLHQLFIEFKARAEEQLVNSLQVGGTADHSVNWLNGGIASANQILDRISEKQSVAKRVDDNLRIIKLKFESMSNEDSLEQKLSFIDKLGYTNLNMLHDELLFKIEKLLAEMLQSKQKQVALDKLGLSTQNKKTAKKKLKKKLKKLQQEAERELN